MTLLPKIRTREIAEVCSKIWEKAGNDCQASLLPSYIHMHVNRPAPPRHEVLRPSPT
jgi:hypothetical protein